MDRPDNPGKAFFKKAISDAMNKAEQTLMEKYNMTREEARKGVFEILTTPRPRPQTNNYN
jgi:hypothetical protein